MERLRAEEVRHEQIGMRSTGQPTELALISVNKDTLILYMGHTFIHQTQVQAHVQRASKVFVRLRLLSRFPSELSSLPSLHVRHRFAKLRARVLTVLLLVALDFQVGRFPAVFVRPFPYRCERQIAVDAQLRLFWKLAAARQQDLRGFEVGVIDVRRTKVENDLVGRYFDLPVGPPPHFAADQVEQDRPNHDV